MTQFARLFAALIVAFGVAEPAGAVDVRSAVLRVDYPTLLPVSRYDRRPDDLGFAGGTLADQDNQTTGNFLGMTFETGFVTAAPYQIDAQLDEILAQGIHILVVMARAEDLLHIADHAGTDVLVINAAARDTSLRDTQCRSNLLHVAPSQVMLADAWCNSPCGSSGAGYS